MFKSAVKDGFMNTYRVNVLYYYSEGQTNGHMEVQAPDETQAIKKVLDFMQQNMKLYPDYTLSMIQVNKIHGEEGG